MSLIDLLFGRPLTSDEESAQQVGPLAGIPMLGLDALSSAAYGPEAAMTLLIPLGAPGIGYVGAIIAVIIGLLFVVCFSYWQTIAAYPGGGGSYTVARQNLGVFTGLVAAAALMLDYVLVVAVGISAGVGALVSAVPWLQPHTLALCLVILVLIALVNLRGVRASGLAFIVPTYLFIFCLSLVLAIGVSRTWVAGGHPAPRVALPVIPAATAAASAWLVVRALANGCTALTGVEAVSNAVGAFRAPSVRYARRTQAAVVGILAILLSGIAYLVEAYQIAATAPGVAGYQSVLAQLVAAVAGRGVLYSLSIGAILSVLALSANTAFAGFPRLCRQLTLDGFLPRFFASRGRRLVYSHGISVLTGCSALLLIVYDGITDRLIPLFAIGAFVAFTLSQAGMLRHWLRAGGPHQARDVLINGLGASATGITLVVVLIAKFTEGAWLAVLLIPLLSAAFIAVKRSTSQPRRD
jgi:amino acid transporter